MHSLFHRFLPFLVLMVWLADGVHAQKAKTDPIEVAARYVLEEQDLAALGPGFVVDTYRFGFRPEPLSPEMQARVDRLAASLGARTRSLEELLVCAPLSPESYGRRCRLIDGARLVLQVNEPKVIEEGLAVNVTTFSFHEEPERNQRWIYAVSREIKLSQNDDGEWCVTGEGFTDSAHFR